MKRKGARVIKQLYMLLSNEHCDRHAPFEGDIERALGITLLDIFILAFCLGVFILKFGIPAYALHFCTVNSHSRTQLENYSF